MFGRRAGGGGVGGLWVRVCVVHGGFGGPIIYPGERKGRCVLESIPEGRKREREEKRKTRIPSAGGAVLRDWRFINTCAHTHTQTNAHAANTDIAQLWVVFSHR